jgi:hypothetical protein
MKKYTLLVFGAIMLFSVLGWTVYAQTRSRARAVWEYRLIVAPSATQVNELGADGWEMVSFSVYADNQYIYFKREK